MKLTIVDYIGEPSCLVGEPTHSKNAGQIGSFLPGFRLKINNVWVATASMGWCPHFFGQFGHVLSRLWVTVFVFWKPGHLFHQLGKIWNPWWITTKFPQEAISKITLTIHQPSSFVFHSLLPWTWVQHQATKLPPTVSTKNRGDFYHWDSRTQHRSPHGCNSSRPKEQCPVQLEARRQLVKGLFWDMFLGYRDIP